MSDKVRVYINARPVDVEAGSTIIQALEMFDASQAMTVRNGERAVTDSRGIVTPSDAPVHNGAIFRIIRARQAGTDDSDLNEM